MQVYFNNKKGEGDLSLSWNSLQQNVSEQGLWADMWASCSAGICFLGVYWVPEVNASRKKKKKKQKYFLSVVSQLCGSVSQKSCL